MSRSETENPIKTKLTDQPSPTMRWIAVDPDQVQWKLCQIGS